MDMCVAGNGINAIIVATDFSTNREVIVCGKRFGNNMFGIGKLLNSWQYNTVKARNGSGIN